MRVREAERVGFLRTGREQTMRTFHCEATPAMQTGLSAASPLPAHRANATGGSTGQRTGPEGTAQDGRRDSCSFKWERQADLKDGLRVFHRRIVRGRYRRNFLGDEPACELLHTHEATGWSAASPGICVPVAYSELTWNSFCSVVSSNSPAEPAEPVALLMWRARSTADRNPFNTLAAIIL